jgi:hypothetical protein
VRASFDDPDLVSCAGPEPVMRLAEACGLRDIVAARLGVPTDKGANASGTVAAIVAGTVTGADSIDDLDVLRHGGMPTLFDGVYAPSTLGSFLRVLSHGHVRPVTPTHPELPMPRIRRQRRRGQPAFHTKINLDGHPSMR